MGLHDNLRINAKLMLQLMTSVCGADSVEFTDNKVSLFSAQWGKCAITDREFLRTEAIHCHHKVCAQGKRGNKLIYVMTADSIVDTFKSVTSIIAFPIPTPNPSKICSPFLKNELKTLSKVVANFPDFSKKLVQGMGHISIYWKKVWSISWELFKFGRTIRWEE